MAVAHTLSSPWVGRLSDRFGRARVLRIDLWGGLLLLPLPALLPTMVLVGLSLALLGFIASFLMSPCSPAVADQVERWGSQSFASGFSVLNLAYSIGMVIGPFLGGALVQVMGFPLALGTMGLSCLVCLTLLRGIEV